MAIQYIDQVELTNKRVIARFDFNVPLNENGEITDSSRIDRALKTIQYIIDNGAKQLVMMSHLGRPKGEKSDKFSLEPVAKYIADKIDQDVLLTESAIDNGLKELMNLGGHKVVLLENLRFHSGEKNNEAEFAKTLASYAEVYVNDAFGVSHREHASVHEIVRYFPRSHYAGFLIQSEVQALDKVLKNPAKPFVGIVGGAKVSDKIKTIEKLLISVDQLLIGGAMAYPFLKAQGKEVGKSLCSDEDVKLASQILKRDQGNKIILPLDHICANSPDSEAENKQDIPSSQMGLDIGELTLGKYKEILSQAKTILWNGPMGLFENPAFAKGTMKLAEIISNTDAYSLVGGGDSVSAVNQSGKADQFSHISTGGGASLEYIEKGDLPGLRALKFGVN